MKISLCLIDFPSFIVKCYFTDKCKKIADLQLVASTHPSLHGTDCVSKSIQHRNNLAAQLFLCLLRPVSQSVSVSQSGRQGVGDTICQRNSLTKMDVRRVQVIVS